MTKPLLATLLLLPLSVSAGELDRKAISSDYGQYHYEFKRGRVVSWLVRGGVFDDEAFIMSVEEDAPKYLALLSKVTWYNSRAGKYSLIDGQLSSGSTTRYALDRARLSLKITEEKANDQVRKQEYQCEVYTSISEFESMLESIKLDKQREIVEAMKDKKMSSRFHPLVCLGGNHHNHNGG